MPPEEKIRRALEVIAACGMVDGEHHKQWVLDQVARALADTDYEIWVQAFRGEWYEGIAP